MTTYAPAAETHTMASDAAYQAWATSIHNAMVGAGFVQTSDTGQSNFGTITRPVGAFTLNANRLYRFADSLQATAPIIIRIDLGTGSAVANFGYRLRVGIATDGAGTFTGALIADTGTSAITASSSSYAGSNNIYACHTEGAGWLCWYYESAALGPVVGFFIARTADSNGDPTAEGATIYLKAGDTQSVVASMRFASTAALLFSGGTLRTTFMPFSTTDTHVGTDIQLLPHWSMTPRIRQIPYIFLLVNGEYTHGTSISAEPFAGRPGTYMPLYGGIFGQGMVANWNAVYGMGLIWE